MKKYTITAYPFAITWGTIEVPDEVEDVEGYVLDNWDDIKFSPPDLDYTGVEFDVEEE